MDKKFWEITPVGERVCVDCAAKFTHPPVEFFSHKFIIRCPPCAAIQAVKDEAIAKEKQKAEDAAIEKKRLDYFIPLLFQETDPSKLPCQSAYEESQKWKFGPTGLVLHGPSGKGKSRCAWLIIRREWSIGRKFTVLDSMAGLKYASKFSDGADYVEEWIQNLIDVELLFMDDIFKNKLTDSFEGACFTLIDQRVQKRKPIIYTSNDTGKSLSGRMTEDRSEPLIRRIREHSTTVTFT